MLYHVFLLTLGVIGHVTSLPVDEKEKSEEKRSENVCTVGIWNYPHGAIFTYPGFSPCIKYRCNNGGFNVVEGACERSGQCVPVDSTIRDGCRSLRCYNQSHGDTVYYRLLPTQQDMCEIIGRCVAKSEPFELNNCQSYRCVDTENGGYSFEPFGERSKGCRDDINNRCVNVGTTFSKEVNGYFYRNCECMSGGVYQCRA